MFTLIIRVTLILIVLFIIMRLMGKKTLGEMQPFEFVIMLVISELACTPMADPAIPLTFGIVPILVVFILHFFLMLLTRKSFRFRKLMDGSPVVVISPDGVEYKALAALNMNLDDLIEATTAQGYFSLSDIYTAYFQTNGSLTVIPTADAAPPTLGDLNIRLPQTTYAVPFIEDGKVCNADKLQLPAERILESVRKFPCPLKEIVVATADSSGTVYIKPKKGKYLTMQIDLFNTRKDQSDSEPKQPPQPNGKETGNPSEPPSDPAPTKNDPLRISETNRIQTEPGSTPADLAPVSNQSENGSAPDKDVPEDD